MLSNPFLYWVDKIYGFFIKIGSNLQSLFLLYMRITWGHQLFLAGLHKLNDIPGTVPLFHQARDPIPPFSRLRSGDFGDRGSSLYFFRPRLAAFFDPCDFRDADRPEYSARRDAREL